MKRIGVLSDTHLARDAAKLPARMLEEFAGAACIVHAGDLTCSDVIDRLERIAPVWSVFGNMDPPELASGLAARAILALDQVTIGITHGHLGGGATTPLRALNTFADRRDVGLVVFGHSHEPYLRRHGDILLFNPGSAVQPRRQPRPSYGILTIDGDQVTAVHRFL
jgi:putative phosphoesterase